MPPKGSKQAELAELKSVTPEPNTGKASEDAKDVKGGAGASKEDAVEPKEASSTNTGTDKSNPAESAAKTTLDSSSKPESDANSQNPEPKPSTTAESGDTPPPPARPARPKPERQISAFSSNLAELATAFPDSDANVRRGMLVAASNNLESAFSGMLALSDETIRPNSYVREQIEHDERLARRIAMSDNHRRRSRGQPSRIAADDVPGSDARSETRSGTRPDSLRRRQSQDSSFGDEMYDGLQRGYNDTKQAVSSFWGSLKQKLNGEIWDDEDDMNAYRSRPTRDNREPLRSQWFPRDPPSSASRPGAGAAGVDAPAPAPAPRLPPRKSSEPALNEEPRSVNAFGDESRVGAKAEDSEPDAFFIGESDDDDLGSLNEDLEIPTKDLPETAKTVPAEKPAETKQDSKQDVKQEAKQDAKQDPKSTTKEKESAKDLLTKVKNESSK